MNEVGGQKPGAGIEDDELDAAALLDIVTKKVGEIENNMLFTREYLYLNTQYKRQNFFHGK